MKKERTSGHAERREKKGTTDEPRYRCVALCDPAGSHKDALIFLANRIQRKPACGARPDNGLVSVRCAVNRYCSRVSSS